MPARAVRRFVVSAGLSEGGSGSRNMHGCSLSAAALSALDPRSGQGGRSQKHSAATSAGGGPTTSQRLAARSGCWNEGNGTSPRGRLEKPENGNLTKAPKSLRARARCAVWESGVADARAPHGSIHTVAGKVLQRQTTLDLSSRHWACCNKISKI